MNRTEWKAEVEKQLILKGMTRSSLAKALGYSWSHVTNTISGSVHSRTAVDRISEALGIEPYRE